jgi:hypothetical protein
MENSYNQGLVAKFNEAGVSLKNTNESSTRITKLVFQYVSIIPLVYVHDFFACLPSISRAEGFSLRMQMNIHKGNSWTITYNKNANANTPLIVKSVFANSSVGNCCPVLVSKAYSAVTKF